MNKLLQTREDKIFDVINYSLLIIILIIVLFPLIFIVSASISDPNAVLQGKVWIFPKDITFEGYRRVFQDQRIWIGYRNTIIYTVLGTSINVVMTVMGAYPLSRKDFCGRNIFTAIITFTMFFGGGLIPNYLLIQNLHMLNTIWVMVIPHAVGVWNIVITRTYFQSNIPVELNEAAQIDGCTNVKFLMSVVLPLSLPIMAVMTLFYGVGHWNSFFNALIYLNDESKYPLQLVLRSILIQNELSEKMMDDVFSMVEKQRISEIIKYSVIIIASFPVLCLYPFLQRYFVKGVMVGSLKG